jgi:hypothetical protein
MFRMIVGSNGHYSRTKLAAIVIAYPFFASMGDGPVIFSSKGCIGRW